MAGPRDEDHRSTDRPPVGCDDLYNADTKVGQMPPALLASLKDQGLTDVEAQPTRAAGLRDPVRPATDGVPRDGVPRLYGPRSNDPEDAATQVHQGGTKVALGPPPESTRLLGQDAPPTLTSPAPNEIPAAPSTAPTPSLPTTSPAPRAATETPSAPPPVTARLANPSGVGRAPFAAPRPPVAHAPFAAPAFAHATAPGAPPGAFAVPYVAAPGQKEDRAQPLHAPRGPADAPLEPRPGSHARWILVVVVSFLIAVAVFGAVVVRYVL